MPIYEYRCQSCGKEFEKLVRRAEDAAVEGCPECGARHLEQQFSTFAARANGGSSAELPSCPSGMCGNPGLCGRN